MYRLSVMILYSKCPCLLFSILTPLPKMLRKAEASMKIVCCLSDVFLLVLKTCGEKQTNIYIEINKSLIPSTDQAYYLKKQLI